MGRPDRRYGPQLWRHVGANHQRHRQRAGLHAPDVRSIPGGHGARGDHATHHDADRGDYGFWWRFGNSNGGRWRHRPNQHARNGAYGPHSRYHGFSGNWCGGGQHRRIVAVRRDAIQRAGYATGGTGSGHGHHDRQPCGGGYSARSDGGRTFYWRHDQRRV